jgi:hypothetical protein
MIPVPFSNMTSKAFAKAASRVDCSVGGTFSAKSRLSAEGFFSLPSRKYVFSRF